MNEQMGEGSNEVDREAERSESVKAASVSAFVGSLASLPISLVAVTFASCALFGVMFRYAVRRDLDPVRFVVFLFAAAGFPISSSTAETNQR